MPTPYHIKIAPHAENQIRQLAVKHQKTIIKFMEALAINPRPPGVMKIEGMTGLHAQAVNHLRVIYKIEDQDVLVLAVK